MFEVLLLGLVTVVIIAIVQRRIKYKNFPPGPVGFPIVGIFPLIKGPVAEQFTKYAKKYGNIFSVRFGTQDVVVLNTHQLITKAFKEEAFAGRPDNDFLRVRNDGKHGVFFLDGPEWQQIRRFALRQLRDFGMGKKALETTVNDEIIGLVEEIQAASDQPMILQNRFNVAVVNALWRITTGERLDPKAPKSREMTDMVSDVIQNTPVTTFFDIPWLRKLWPPAQKRATQITNIFMKLKNVFKVIIDEHKAMAEDEETNDLVTLFLKEAKVANPDPAFIEDEGLTNLKITLLDLFGAGSDTTSTSLNWLFLNLAKDQEVQRKVHEEIDNVIGDRVASIDDKEQMPYTIAVLNETLRFSTIVPLSAPHRVLYDTNFEGYQIPKDTIVLGNIYSVLHDPETWEKPNEFYPGHFLGNMDTKKDAFMPFSTGRRVCLGESLARMQLFLFATNLLQKFEFHLENPTQILEATEGIIRSPKPRPMLIKTRNKKL